jgi:L-ascorbate metabolism protein UlaG (beta-lactamase superfamily)
MQLTYLDSNSWLMEISGKRILLDPWLVGDLVFGNLPWLFKGRKNTERAIPENLDLILLSQGLEDHAHPPTLKVLDHNIPVVGSVKGAKVVADLGYTEVITLEHGQSYILDQVIEIKALPGSPTGVQTVENAYLLTDLVGGHSLYYEPHGYHAPLLKENTTVDVIITPIIDLKIPLLGAVIKGQKTALEVCQWLKPQFILPTAAGGDIHFEGLLMSILTAEGTPAGFQELLQQNQLKTQVINPQPWEALTLNLAEKGSQK